MLRDGAGAQPGEVDGVPVHKRTLRSDHRQRRLQHCNRDCCGERLAGWIRLVGFRSGAAAVCCRLANRRGVVLIVLVPRAVRILFATRATCLRSRLPTCTLRPPALQQGNYADESGQPVIQMHHVQYARPDWSCQTRPSLDRHDGTNEQTRPTIT